MESTRQSQQVQGAVTTDTELESLRQKLREAETRMAIVERRERAFLSEIEERLTRIESLVAPLIDTNNRLKKESVTLARLLHALNWWGGKAEVISISRGKIQKALEEDGASN